MQLGWHDLGIKDVSDENTEEVNQRTVRGVKRSPQNVAGGSSKKKLLWQNGNTVLSSVNLLMLVFVQLFFTTEFLKLFVLLQPVPKKLQCLVH